MMKEKLFTFDIKIINKQQKALSSIPPKKETFVFRLASVPNGSCLFL